MGMNKYAVDRVQNYIAGKFVPSTGREHLTVTNPATGDKIGDVPMGGKGDVDAAVTAAAKAFPGWRDTPVAVRTRYLFELRNVMEKNYDELLSICTQEHGKTIEESKGDVRRGIENVETACAMPTMMKGEALENIANGIDCVSYRQPMGVFGIIAPYNFPSMVPLWFLPYAIASGNTVVVKPSEQVPFSQHRLFELIDQIGLPPGVLNLVHGGKDIVNGMLDHKGISGVSFVGSSAVAEHVYARCGATGKRVQALGGAKNFTIVTDQCDWEKSVANIVDSAFGCAGQRCLATSIVVGVGKNAESKLRDMLVEHMKKIKVGEGHTTGVTMGPVISARHKEKVLGYIEKGVKEGAELVIDGRNAKVDGLDKGHFLGASLFSKVTPQMTIGHEEIFGPVLSMMSAGSLDEAIALVNAHPLANASSIYTQHAQEVRKFVREIHPAMVGVNIGVAAPMSYFGFGGSKGSFFGDLKGHGTEQVQFYTQNKTAITRYW